MANTRKAQRAKPAKSRTTTGTSRASSAKSAARAKAVSAGQKQIIALEKSIETSFDKLVNACAKEAATIKTKIGKAQTQIKRLAAKKQTAKNRQTQAAKKAKGPKATAAAKKQLQKMQKAYNDAVAAHDAAKADLEQLKAEAVNAKTTHTKATALRKAYEKASHAVVKKAGATTKSKKRRTRKSRKTTAAASTRKGNGMGSHTPAISTPANVAVFE